jgi:hypothetical protein
LSAFASFTTGASLAARMISTWHGLDM